MSEIKFAGQVALVTGASRGIGAAIAHELVARGLIVIGTATSEAGAAKISSALGAMEGAAAGCRGAVLDVNDVAVAEALIDDIVKAHGALQVLVNNAGITRDNISMRMKDEEWEKVLQVNLTGTFRLTRAVMRGMMKRRFGRVVNITSIVGVTGNPGQANYAAAKAGLIGMSKSLAQELASRGITVNCVAPGFIATPMTDALSDEQKKGILARVPADRLGTPDEIAAGVVYLASEEAAYVTGQTLHINGGMAMI
jgi:3-oxoacyl-[acyl-carrier protein] reductase